jgi:uncharacterized protein YjbI with pentapeptide repeats
MDWPPADRDSCDGTVGLDARKLAKDGTLAGIHGPLSGCDYRGADLSTADLSGLPLRGYVFACAQLHLATLQDASWLRCDLRWADLSAANLRRASLSACDLRHTDLTNADLRGARFGVAQDHDGWRPCHLGDADLSGADLRGCRYHTDTIWPTGFDPEIVGAQPLN